MTKLGLRVIGEGMLEKTFQPDQVEPRIYAAWEEAGAFRAGRRPDAKPYCIVIPPPNVTGSLHMGHALNNTLQDALVRFERMRGRDVLWQPGMDHAGIATQMVVERQLAAEGANITRRDMGREAFVERVWTWKAESGGTIIGQLRRLGASCDWSREAFTMDETLSRAVLKVFVTLYKEGLLYKDKRLVNWDPKLLTAISDLEVVNREVEGAYWHFKYPVEGEKGRFVTVATTRPETMLGDTAVAVNPEDDRYKDLQGKHVILPLVGRRIPIVADEYADPEQGSGAVKITPAHDFNDFEVGRRHDLPMINIMDAQAALNEEVPEPFRGLDRYEARKAVIAAMEAEGLLAEIETTTHTVPYGDRSDVVIEPWLTDQWYVDAKTLAGPAITAVERGETVFVPRNWEKTYFEWMRNIQPWCVSRQLWWGHRIPAWYGPDGEVFVAETPEAAKAEAEAKYQKPVALAEDLPEGAEPPAPQSPDDFKEVPLRRDTDVLDTWFSSALWPFSTLGWPDDTEEVKRYYQTDVLVTGFDIIFFWVARMMMMGLHFKNEVPFHTVYIHALVRDEKGQKMSKSKGNVMDPLELVDKYGADALRFTLAAMAAQGRDIKLSPARVEGYRNFGTKLWNAARFCQMNECVRAEGFDPAGAAEPVNRWILGRAERAAAAVTEAIEAYKFNEAAGALYSFVWHVFCDWYLEFTKPLLNGPDGPAKSETRATVAFVLDQAVAMLHPFMPFLTEELWDRLAEHGPARESMLIEAQWPGAGVLGGAKLFDAAADGEMEWVVEAVSEIRSVRSEMNVPAGARIQLIVKDAGAETRTRLKTHEDVIKTLARLDTIRPVGAEAELPKGSVQVIVGEATFALPLAEVIDIAQETARLQKEIAKAEGEAAKIDKKLANEKFLAKAPAEVVEEQRERKADALGTRDRLAAALARLQSAR